MAAETGTDSNVWKRFFDLVGMIMKLVRDGNRKLEDVCDFIQLIRDRADFATDFKAFLASRREDKPKVTPTTNFASIWRQVYAKLGITADFDDLTRVEDRPGYWPIVVLKGLTPQKVVNAIKEANLFPAWQYASDLDTVIAQNDRDPNQTGSYVVYVRANQEADPEFSDLSANQLKARGIKGITLLERLLLEVFYFIFSRGQHLDINSITLCSGSRDPGGGVSRALWLVDAFSVRWCHPDDRRNDVRARVVVS